MNLARYTTPLGFSSLFAFCGLPLRLDSYKGCGFQCSYCFARAREGVSGTPQIKPADPQMLSRRLKRVFIDQSENLSIISKCLQHRMPLHFGVMGDPFQPAERLFGVSLSYLRTITEYHYPLVISTRGELVAESPYIDLLKDHGLVVVRMSLSTTNNCRSSLVEKDNVNPARILKTMEKLRSSGIRVACRWQPFVPGISEEPEVFAAQVANAGCQHCSFEFLRLPRERNRQLIEGFQRRTGGNIYDYYLGSMAMHRVREYILPPEVRLPMILRARNAIRGAGMSFGAADNDFQYLSDNACCCSGVDAFPGFEGFFRHQIAYAVQKNIGRQFEYCSIAKEWTPTGSVDRYLNSTRAKRGTVRQHIRHLWNSSGLEGSPDSFFGVEATDEFSKDGMKIYKWNREKLAKFQGSTTG